jgi:hypothetical protein
MRGRYAVTIWWETAALAFNRITFEATPHVS